MKIRNEEEKKTNCWDFFEETVKVEAEGVSSSHFWFADEEVSQNLTFSSENTDETWIDYT